MELRADLSGDGRKTVEPDAERDYFGNPQPVNLGAARQLIAYFIDQGGRSDGHSRLGQTIWVEQEWCELQGLDYDPVTVEVEDKTVVVGIETEQTLERSDFDLQFD